MRRSGVFAALTGVAVLGSTAIALAEKEIAAAPPNRYTASVVTIDQGERVTFRNGDVASHDVTARQAGPDKRPLFASRLIDGGDTAPVERAEHLTTGDYAFFCSVHPSMEGTLRVSAAGTPVPRPGSGEPSPPPQPGPGIVPGEDDLSVSVLSRASAIRRTGRMKLRLVGSEPGTARVTVRFGKALAFRGSLGWTAGKQTRTVRVKAKARKAARTGRSYTVRSARGDSSGELR